MRFYKMITAVAAFTCSLVLVQHASPANIFAASSSLQDVQAAVSLAANGDRVVIPPGSSTWASTLLIRKSIELTGGGTYAVNASHQDAGTWPLTITFSHGADGIDVAATGGYVRITGIKFLGTVSYGSNAGGAIGIVSTNTAAWRIDNCYFNLTGNAAGCACSGLGGLIDHIYAFDPSCTANNGIVAQDIRNDFTGGWAISQPVGFGGSSFMFIEDSTFWKDVAIGAASCYFLDAQAGGKIVLRHNYGNNTFITWHGTDTSVPERGGYAFEIYDNEFVWALPQYRCFCAVFARGGPSLIYNNKATNYTDFVKTWVRRTEESEGIFGLADGTHPWDGNWGGAYPVGYPVMDQPGRGQAAGWGTGPSYEPLNVQPQAVSEMYIWNNKLINTDPIANADPLYVVQGRDYELSADSSAQLPGYTPYTYPHPLQSGSSTVRPNPPTGLRLK